MTKIDRWLVATVFVFVLSFAGHVNAADSANIVYLDVPAGRVVIELRPDLAPNTVARFKELVKRGFYNGLTFHRVIDGFMAQGGDPKGDGTGGSGQKLKAEFSQAHHVRGTVSMARASDPDSADSQFFICYASSPNLDGQYTIFGQVTSGMEFIDALKKGDPARSGTVSNPDRIIRARVVDVQEDKDKEARFQTAAQDYRAQAVKPQLPEDARRFKVQAEGAVRDKDFIGAAVLYDQALGIAPWWPEGHFNRALVLAGTDEFSDAIVEMKRYLTLVPDATDARAAQDKIYEWERKAPTAR